MLCRPRAGASDAGRQAETVYEALVDALASEAIGPDALLRETVFLRRIGEDHEAARSARARILGGVAACRPAITLIGQPPLGRGAQLEVAAMAVVPRPGTPSATDEVTAPAACGCEGCAPGLRAKVLHLGDDTSLHAGNVYGAGRDAFEQAYDMFRAADRLLAAGGMSFRDVVRTWIHVRDIARDYGALNRARREFFRRCGIEREPASTGVQGVPFSAAHDFSMSLYAVSSPRPLDVTVMSTPWLNEAPSYGADFSRGLRLAQRNGVTLHVSGTASVDEAGRTAHVGDFAGQVDRMFENIASLLAGEGASFANVVSGVAYLKHPGDAPVLRSMFRDRGFEGFPCALVAAPLCRPELLCETEVVAVLPATAGAD